MKIEIDLTEQQIAAIIAAAQAQNDAIAPSVTPPPTAPAGHVYMPMTKHVLPLPDPEDNFWSYVCKNFAAAGGIPGQQGPYRVNAAFVAQAKAEGRAPSLLGQDSYPEAMDRMYNPASYESAEERAKREREETAAEKATWVSDPGRTSTNPALTGGGTEDVAIEQG